jgi:predicted Zn-dependent protease
MANAGSLQVDYFDGQTSRAQPAWLSVQGGQLLVRLLEPGAAPLHLRLEQVQWSERTRHGARSARLPGGAALHARDAAGWDAWVQQHVRRDGWVVRVQQSWRGVALAGALLVLAVFAVYQWGLPAAARVVTPMIPAAVDEALGRNALAHLEHAVFQPSALPPETQTRLRQRVAGILASMPDAPKESARIEFRKSKIGPNALALPGGTIVVTDELVNLVQDDNIVLGVIGHELGHVRHRHGMRQLVQVSALQVVLSVTMGDYASFLTTAPLVIAAMGYSRDHEREADVQAVHFLRAAGISPAVMAAFFERIRERRKDPDGERPLGISIVSSHPDDAERIAFFRAAAQQP